MKNYLSGLAIAALVIVSGSANAFSVAARGYSQKAFQEIIESNDVIGQLPVDKDIASIEQVSSDPYQFEVKSGKCTVTVELSTETPKGFIGSGFPHDPKVVETHGCDQN